MISVASIKAQLKNRAITDHRTLQEIFTVYGLERTLYRLSISPHRDHFVLKGGILLYALYQGDFSRGTTDIDLLGHDMGHHVDSIRQCFIDIFSIDYADDGLKFDLSSLKAETINTFQHDPGVNVSVTGYLDRTRITVRIDIGFGDVVYPEARIMEYPALLDQPTASLRVYSIESVIAEKFQAIVSLGDANTRMKDFYDIHALSSSNVFDRETLTQAVKETFANRNTGFGHIRAFEDDFIRDPLRARLWTSFMKAKDIEYQLDFEEIMRRLMIFLLPVINMSSDVDNRRMVWNPEHYEWQMIIDEKRL